MSIYSPNDEIADVYNALTIQGISSISLVACEPLPSGPQNLNIQHLGNKMSEKHD